MQNVDQFLDAPGASAADKFLDGDSVDAFLDETPDSGQGRLASAGNAFMQGGGVAVGQTLQGGERALRASTSMGMPEGFETVGGLDDQIRAQVARRRTLTPAQNQAEIQAGPLYRAGGALAEGAKEAYTTNPKFKGEFWTDTIPASAGAMVPTIAAGGVGGVVAGGLQYGLSAGQSEAQAAIDAGHAEAADKVFLLNLGIGATSEGLLGIGANIFKLARAARTAKLGEESAKKIIAKAIAKGATTEAAQEGLEQIGQNAVAGMTYDPERGVFVGVPTAMAAGLVMGGGGGGVAGSLGALNARKPPAPSLPVETDDNSATMQGIEQTFNQRRITPAQPGNAARFIFNFNGNELAYEGVTEEQAKELAFRQNPGATFVRAEPLSPAATEPATVAPEQSDVIEYAPWETGGGTPGTSEQEDSSVDYPYSAARVDIEPQTTSELAPDGNKVVAVEFPLSQIEVDPVLVPQFKNDADETSGEVRGEELKGNTYQRPSNPIVIWQLKNGRNIVVTGRHRFALAKRLGEQTIPATIVREADGFTRQNAITLDAEFNIRDGNGSVDDYANYIENTPQLTEEEARARGLLDRAKGEAAWSLARLASNDLKALYRAGKIQEREAVAIASAAPGDVGTQAIGIKSALAGKSAAFIRNLMIAAAGKTKETGRVMADGEFPWGDDTSILEMEAQAERASQFQKEISEQIRAVQGAAKRPDVARKLGVDVQDPAGIALKIVELKNELARWQNWPLHSDLVSKAKGLPPGAQMSLAQSDFPTRPETQKGMTWEQVKEISRKIREEWTPAVKAWVSRQPQNKPLVFEDGPNRVGLVSPEPTEPGKWRTTRFVGGEPFGHMVFNSREEAVLDALTMDGFKSHAPNILFSLAQDIDKKINRLRERQENGGRLSVDEEAQLRRLETQRGQQDLLTQPVDSKENRDRRAAELRGQAAELFRRATVEQQRGFQSVHRQEELLKGAAAYRAEAKRLTELADKLDGGVRAELTLEEAPKAKDSPQLTLFSVNSPAAPTTATADVQKIVTQEAGDAPVRVIHDATLTHNGQMVEGYLDPNTGQIVINAAAPTMRDPANVRRVIREERAHWLLASAEGQAELRQFAGRLTPSQRATLQGQGYRRQKNESAADYETRLHNEFIAKQARENTAWWRKLVERVREWLAQQGLATLTNAEAARAILRRLNAAEAARNTSRAGVNFNPAPQMSVAAQVAWAWEFSDGSRRNFTDQAEATAFGQGRAGRLVQTQLQPWWNNQALADELRSIATTETGRGSRLIPEEGTSLDEYVVYRGDEQPPRIVRVRDIGIGDDSRISNSQYPVVELQLSNGTKLIRHIRISDHGQVSRNAPSGYSTDIRHTGKTHIGNKLTSAVQEKIKEALSGEVEATWDQQRSAIENANPAIAGGVAGIKTPLETQSQRAEAQADKSNVAAGRSEEGSALTRQPSQNSGLPVNTQFSLAPVTPVSPETQTQIAVIEQQSGNVNEFPAAPRLATSPELRSKLRDMMGTVSGVIHYYGGAALLRAKRGIDLTASYQAAAVSKQSDALLNKLFSNAYTATSGFKLPQWMKTGAWARRVVAFKKRLLHVAARLNATARNPDGSFKFENFKVRSGLMTMGAFKKGEHTVGDTFMHIDPVTEVQEEFEIGPFVMTPDGRMGHQLYRSMDAKTQAELYRTMQESFPELTWLLDMFIDPALADVRQTINGIQIPVFNRFAQATMMAEGNPNFEPLTGYTPDVLVSRSLLGAIRGALSFTQGVRSPGRKYKFGTSRESGHVRDLLTGFNIRTFQMLQEKARREWRNEVFKAARPIEGGLVPAGWVKLETGMEELWQAAKRLQNWTSPESWKDITKRVEEEGLDAIEEDMKEGESIRSKNGRFYLASKTYPETEARLSRKGELDETRDFDKFFKEVRSLRGKQLMLPQPLVNALLKRYAVQVEHGALYKLGAWAIRNSTQLFLVAPKTYVANVATNDLFTLEAATRYGLRGLLAGNTRDLRFARNLFSGMFTNRFAAFRQGTGMFAGSDYMTAIRETLPDQVFADNTSLADVKVRWGHSALDYLRQGEIGGFALQLIQYGQIDVRGKQRMAFAFLKATAVSNAKRAGLKGKALKAAVDRYLINPPQSDRVQAVTIANFELLNYADSPQVLEDFGRNDYSRLVLPFPRFGYHYVTKQLKRLSAAKLFLGKVPKGQRADAFADLVTVGLYGLGGGGIVANALLSSLSGDDDDDARQRIGTSTVPVVQPDGGVTLQPIDRQFVTANRINLSAWARAMGIESDNDYDFWLRVRNYPVIAAAGVTALAYNDAKKHGAALGARQFAAGAGDLAMDFFSIGAAVRVPSKVFVEWQSMGKPTPASSPFDPFATGVPLSFYITEQLTDSIIPGSRQADELLAWVNPVRPRRTASKTLGYSPGVVESLESSHWTGLINNLARGGESGLPPAGAIDRRTSTVPIPSTITPTERLSSVLGVNIKAIPRQEYQNAINP